MMTRQMLPRFSVALSTMVLVLGIAPIADAALDSADVEFRFLSELVNYGFPDFAEKRLREVEARYPAEGDRLKLARAEILVARRKFEEAEAIADQMPAGNPKADAIRLSLANALYSIGEEDRADDLYNAFFASYKDALPTDEDLLRFYQESAYRLVQMREAAADFEGAASAYELLLRTDPPENTQRRVLVELAELYLKAAENASGGQREAFLKKAEEKAADVRWGGYDIWFGRSISVTAMAEVMRNDRKAAQELIQNYMEDLRQIDTALKDSGTNRSLSPLAGARYLLGKLYQEDFEAVREAGNIDQAKQLLGKALTEFANVFKKYPKSDWGPDAGVRFNKLRKAAAELGNLKQEGGQGLASGSSEAAQIADAAYQEANNLYRQEKFPAAIDAYLKVANDFPEADATLRIMGRLMTSLAQAGRHLEAKVVADSLAERFPSNSNAAVSLLLMGKYYFDLKQPDDYFWYYDTYVESFKEHDKVPQILYTLSALSGKQGDQERETAYLNRLMNEHPQSKFSNMALSKQAFDLYKRGQYAEAIPALQKYLAAEQPGLQRAQGMLALADAYKQTEQFSDALRAYNTIVKTLSPVENNPYRGTLEEEKVLEILKTATFFVGFALQKIDVPDSKLEAVRSKAIQAYRNFLQAYSETAPNLAPKALRQIGTLQLELGQTDEAASTFDEISSRYPDSPEGRDASFLLVDSLIELEKYEEARAAFGRMLDNQAEYTPSQYARIGQLMLDREFYEEALASFNLAGETSDDPAVEQRVLFGRGESMYHLEQYDAAVEALNTLLTQYETTSRYYDAKFLLASAYRKMGKYEEAAEPLNDVFKFAPEAWRRNKASLELARLQQAALNDNAALASYLRVALLGNPGDEESRPFIQTSILEGVELAQKLEDWENAAELVQTFLNDYPSHEKIPELRRLRNQINLRLQTVQ